MNFKLQSSELDDLARAAIDATAPSGIALMDALDKEHPELARILNDGDGRGGHLVISATHSENDGKLDGAVRIGYQGADDVLRNVAMTRYTGGTETAP